MSDLGPVQPMLVPSPPFSLSTTSLLSMLRICSGDSSVTRSLYGLTCHKLHQNPSASNCEPLSTYVGTSHLNLFKNYYIRVLECVVHWHGHLSYYAKKLLIALTMRTHYMKTLYFVIKKICTRSQLPVASEWLKGIFHKHLWNKYLKYKVNTCVHNIYSLIWFADMINICQTTKAVHKTTYQKDRISEISFGFFFPFMSFLEYMRHSDCTHCSIWQELDFIPVHGRPGLLEKSPKQLFKAFKLLPYQLHSQNHKKQSPLFTLDKYWYTHYNIWHVSVLQSGCT